MQSQRSLSTSSADLVTETFFGQLSEEKQQVIKELFERIDKNHNGVLEKEELRGILEVMIKQDPNLIENLGLKNNTQCSTDEDILNAIFDQLDLNGDEVLSFREFAEPFARMLTNQM